MTEAKPATRWLPTHRDLCTINNPWAEKKACDCGLAETLMIALGNDELRIDTERARAERAEAQAARLRKALQGARQAINDAPIDTWGVNYSGDPSVPQGSYSWPMKDEYLHHIDAALKEPANG